MTVRFATLTLCLLAALPVHAERADRDKPMLLEASRVSIDDAKKIQILEGDVVITKGTMILKADRVVITEDQYGFQKGTAFSGKDGLARFRQKREGKNEWVEGEGERIEHDARSELSQFFQRGRVKSGEDEVRGQYIQFNGLTETYLVTNGPNATTVPSQQGRVQVTIQPKKKDAPAKP